MKRCVCGRSNRYPICDNSHEGEGWTCAKPSVETAAHAFMGSTHLLNLADRLAHRFSGVSLHQHPGPIVCEQLTVITDGIDPQNMVAAMGRVTAERIRILAVDQNPDALRWLFPDAVIMAIPGDPLTTLWSAAERGVICEAPSKEAPPRPHVFISHAVADEGRIFPALDALRTAYHLTLFVCADSVPPGAHWHAEIETELRRSDVFVQISSAAVSRSVYCAFEAGMATALNIPMRLVDLDGGCVPTYAAHRQAVDIPRTRVRKPWLTDTEALLDALLSLLVTNGK